MNLHRALCLLALFMSFLLAGCGTMATPADDGSDASSERPKTGRWSLEYTGGCTGREAEAILVTHLDDNTLIFDDFELRRDDDGQFTGSADFVAPMPADGRDVIYTIAYSLRDVGEGKYAGTETITEGGGHSLDCPVELVYVGEPEP